MYILWQLTKLEWLKLRKHPLTWGLLVGLLLILTLHMNSLYRIVQADPPLADKVDAYMQAQVDAFAPWEVNATVLIGQGEDILFSRGYGWANREKEIPQTPTTSFALASITKQFTAVAMMQLVEQGALTLDTPLSQFFPDFPQSDEITMHHLLTHSAGIPNGVDLTVPASLDFPPGTDASYSNVNFLLLGEIVTQVSGQSYAEYMQQHIFQPLGMNASGFALPSADNVAVPYRWGLDGPEATIPIGAEAGGAGGLYSSTEDLYRWQRAMAEGTLLNEDSMARLTTPVFERYAYGLMVETLFDRKVITHGGGADGVVTFMARFPEEDMVIILLSNTGWTPANDIYEDFAAILFGEEYDLPEKQQVVVVNPALFDEYAGIYDVEGGMHLRIYREENRLLAEMISDAMPNDSMDLPLYPTSEVDFFTPFGNMSFISDKESGAVNTLRIQAGAMTMDAVRRGTTSTIASTTTNQGQQLATQSFSTPLSIKHYREALTYPIVLNRILSLVDWINIAIILLGINVVGREFSWGTMRMILARGIPRHMVILSKLLALVWVAGIYILIMWVASAVLGWVTTREIAGSVDWQFLQAPHFWQQPFMIMGRVWLVVIPFIAFTLALNMWLGRPGPAFSLLFLCYFLSLFAYVLGMTIVIFFAVDANFDPVAMGQSWWGKTLVLLPHFNSRIILYWADPSPLAEMDYSIRQMTEIFQVTVSPWLSIARLWVCGLLSFMVAWFSFSRREMTE